MPVSWIVDDVVLQDSCHVKICHCLLSLEELRQVSLHQQKPPSEKTQQAVFPHGKPRLLTKHKLLTNEPVEVRRDRNKPSRGNLG